MITLRKMGLVILTMAQPEIVGMMIQMMMMVTAHTLRPYQMSMTNPQYPITQQKSKTQQTTQEWKSKMKPKSTEKIRTRIPKTRTETANQYMNMETISQKTSNVII